MYDYDKNMTNNNRLVTIQVVIVNIGLISKQLQIQMQQDLQQYNEQNSNSKSEQVHFDYDEEEENLTPLQKMYESAYEQQPQNQLQHLIMQKIRNLQKQQDTISKQLQLKLDKLLQQIAFSTANNEQKLKLRMHELALSKILVNTHGKTDFYLIKAHHHLGQAYLNYKCYQQALDHLTISLKKNAKINDINEIKLYHSYVLTTYSRCYFQISSYDDALQILKKAIDIQLSCQNQTTKIDNIQTLKLISNSYLKLKNYPQSLLFAQKVLSALQNKNGKNSKQYARAKIQKAKILICQQSTQKQAITSLQSAIQTLLEIKYENYIEIADYYELLAQFYQKTKNYQKQIQNLYKKCQIYVQQYEEGHEKSLKVKKNIATLLQKYNRTEQAIKEFQQILEYEQKFHPENRVQIGKTLKALGTCYLSLNSNLSEAQQYLKRAQKLLAENGVSKTNREIKYRLQEIRQRKQTSKQVMTTIEKQITHNPIQTIN